MILSFWHSLVWIPPTPTRNGVYQIWYCFVAFSIIRRGADDESLSFSRRGGKSRKPNYLMMLFLWHSLLLVVTKPTCDGVYQVWYGFVLISITRRGGMDDKLWISWQNGHAYLVAVRFDSFFHVTILFFTRPPLYKPWGISVWRKLMKKCSF